MPTLLTDYTALPDGAPAGQTQHGLGASAVSGGVLLSTGLANGQVGGRVQVASVGGRLWARGRLHLVAMGVGGAPAGGVVLLYADDAGTGVGFHGFRVGCRYIETAIFQNANLRIELVGSHSGDSNMATVGFLTGKFLLPGDVVVMEAQYTPGVGALPGLVQFRAYWEGAAVPAYQSVPAHVSYAALVGPAGLMDKAGEGLGSNTRWLSLETSWDAPAAPVVAVTGVGTTSAFLSGDAFSDADPGALHAWTDFAVWDGDGDPVYGPVRVLAADLGPHLAAGLPLDTAGLVAGMRYGDQRDTAGEWGYSAPFTTQGPPAAPAVLVYGVTYNRATLAGSAFEAATPGHDAGLHAFTDFQVYDTLGALVLYGPVRVLAADVGPHLATPLPSYRPGLTGQMRYGSTLGLVGGWGSSPPFRTAPEIVPCAPPLAPGATTACVAPAPFVW